MWVERSVHKLLQKHSIKACCCVTVSAEFKCGLKEESLVSVHVRFLNSHVLVKVKCLPGSQARDKRKFMCKSAPEGAVQFCVQALVQYVRNLHQNTAFRLKSFLFTGFILLCTADWTYWGNTEGPHFVVLCFFSVVFSAQEGNTFLVTVLLHLVGTFLTNLLENVFWLILQLQQWRIQRDGWLLLICLWLLWNALVLKQFSAVPQFFLLFLKKILCILVAMNGPCTYCDALS